MTRRYAWKLAIIIGLMLTLVASSATAQFSDDDDDASMPAAVSVRDILDRDVLRVGVQENFPPFASLENRITNVGFEIDIAREFALRWLGSTTKVEFVRAVPRDRIALLNEGRVDMVIATMSPSWETEATIDFSQIYFENQQGMLVRRTEEGLPEYNNILDLKDVTVGAAETFGIADNFQLKTQALDITIELQGVRLLDQGVDFLQSESIDVFTADIVTLARLANENPDVALANERFGSTVYSIGVPEGASELRKLINATLQSMKQDGVYDALFLKWFNDIPTGLSPYPLTVYADSPAEFFTERYAEFENFSVQRPNLDRLTLIDLRDGVLVVGVHSQLPPFGFYNDTGQLIGFDVDLTRAIASEWGIDTTSNLKLVPLITQTRIETLLNNQADFVVAAMTRTWGREQLIDFSQTYFEDGQGIAVPATSDVQTLADLDNQVIGANSGSTSFSNVTVLAAQANISVTTRAYATTSEGIAAMINGEIEAYTTDRSVLTYLARENSDIRVLDETYTRDPFGLGLPAGEAEFHDLINCTLQRLKANGIYDIIYRRWFGPESEPFALEVLSGACPVVLQ